jgi:hypothetical protein
MIIIIILLLLLGLAGAIVAISSGGGESSGGESSGGGLMIMGDGDGSDRDPTIPSVTPNGYTPTQDATLSANTPESDVASLDTDGLISQELIDKIRKYGPGIARDLAIGAAAELAMVVTYVVAATAIQRIAVEGLKSGTRTTGKLIMSSTIEFMMKWGGVVSQRAANRAIAMATERNLQSIAHTASTNYVSKQLASNGVQSITQITDPAIRRSITEGAEQAAQQAVEKEVRELEKQAAKQGAKAATKAAATAARAGASAAVSVGSKAAIAGTRLAAMASSGPVSAALAAVAVVGLALDFQCCGGYCEVAGPDDYLKIRDSYDKEWTSNVSSKGVRLPIIYGPFDKKTPEEQGTLYAKEIDNICRNTNNPQIKSIVNDGIDRVANRTINTPNELRAYIVSRAPEIGIQAEKNVCTQLDGKVIYENSNVYCSYKDKSSCESSFKWPISEANGSEFDTYVTWNSERGECNKDPVSHNMRLVCELGEFPFNKDTKSCDITSDYCLRKGMDFDGKKCVLSKGQEACELMLSTTICRGMRQLTEEDQYEPCPTGSRRPTELAALTGGLTGGIIDIALCARDNACPAEQETVSGLCYSTCADEARFKGKTGTYVDYWGQNTQNINADASKVQGWCYEQCPSGTVPTTASTCARYAQTKPSSDEKVASCPVGNKRLATPGMPGPADLCQQECPTDYRRWTPGGLCYHKNVPVNDATPKTPRKTCPSGTNIRRDDCIDCGGDPWSAGSCWADDIFGHNTRSHQGTIVDITRECGEGYKLEGISCLPVSRPVSNARPVSDIGVCSSNKGTYPQGHYKQGQQYTYDKIGGMCYTPCDYFGRSWIRTPGGLTCILPADDTTRDSFLREDKGTKYRAFPRPRKIPWGTTEDGSGCYKAGTTIFNPPS